MHHSDLSSFARRRTLRLRLERIREKIGSVEARIAAIEGEPRPESGLFPQEYPGLRSVRARLTQLRELAAGIEEEPGPPQVAGSSIDICTDKSSSPAAAGASPAGG